MKAAETRTDFATNNTLQKKQMPFFNKEEQGGFFLKHIGSPMPFFSPATIQPKPASPSGRLTIGQPNDKYEQEADAVADQVMKMSVSQITPIQRKCETCEEEEEFQMMPINTAITPVIQRRIEKKKNENLIQAKAADAVTCAVTPDIEASIQSLRGGGQPLSNAERSFFEPRFGADFSGVRVHNNTQAAGLAQSMNARAFTHGREVVFGAGEYSLYTLSGKKLFAHELTHVIQQNGGSSKKAKLASKSITNTELNYRQPLTPISSQASNLIQCDHGDEPRYTPVIIRTTNPVEVVRRTISLANRILTNANRSAVSENNFYIAVFRNRSRIDYYRGTTFKGSITLSEEAVGVSPGIYFGGNRDENGATLMGLYNDHHNDVIAIRAVVAEDPERRNVNAMSTADERQVAEWGEGATEVIYVRSISQSNANQSNEDEGGDGGGDESEREQINTPAPEWARQLTSLVKSKLEIEQQNVVRMAARTASISGVEGEIVLLRRAGGIADRVVLWHRDSTPYLNVWASGDRRAIRLNQTDDAATTYARIVAVTRAIYLNTQVGASQTAEEISLDLPGSEGEIGDFVPANSPPYPSSIRNLGPDIGIVDATQRFSMHVDFSRDGRWATLAAFGVRRYTWELIKLRDQAGLATESESVGRRVLRREGALADMDRNMDNIGEDIQNSSDGEILTGLVGLDAGVRSVGTLIGTAVSLASQPSNEQAMQFQGAGTYIVRCVSARPQLEREDAPENAVVNAPSVSIHVIRVMTIEARAQELTQNDDIEEVVAQLALAELRQLLVESVGADGTALEEGIASLEQLLATLRNADQASTLTHLNASLSSIREQLQFLNELEEAQNQSRDPNTYAPTLRLLWVQLQLASRTIAQERLRLEQSRTQLTQQQRASSRASGSLKQGRHFRPHVSFVPEDSGRALPILMMLGEHANSSEGARIWVLIDVSVPGHADPYEGRSSSLGSAGHVDAIRNVFTDFAGEVPYGRGMIGVRMPETLTDYIGAPLTVPDLIRATPDAGTRWIQRLESLATAASIAGLIVTGPVGAAIGVVGAVSGGAVAAYRIRRRSEGGYLEFDLATVLEVTAVLSAFTSPLGLAAGSLAKAGRWTAITGRIEHGIEIAGYLELGSQTFVIPATLIIELHAIDSDSNLSPGERAARRAMAFLNATRSGLEFAVSTHRTLTNLPTAPRDYTNNRRASPDVIESISRRTRTVETSDPTRVVDQVEPLRRNELPENRTPVNDEADIGGNRQIEEANEPVRDRDDGIEIINLPEGTVMQAPDNMATDRSFATDMFITAYRDNSSNEVLLLKNNTTGEYIVVQGDGGSVSLGRGNTNWQELLPVSMRGRGTWIPEMHTHPVDASGVTPLSSHWPSGGGGDFHSIAWVADITGRANTHEILFRTADGMQRTLFGYDPASPTPLWVDVPSPTGGRIRESFATIEDYHAFYQERFGFPPSHSVNPEFRGARRTTTETSSSDNTPEPISNNSDTHFGPENASPPTLRTPNIDTNSEGATLDNLFLGLEDSIAQHSEGPEMDPSIPLNPQSFETPESSNTSPPQTFREALDRIRINLIPSELQEQLRRNYREDYSRRPQSRQPLRSEEDYIRFVGGHRSRQWIDPPRGERGEFQLGPALGRAHENDWARYSDSPQNPGPNAGGRFRTPFGNVEPDFIPKVSEAGEQGFSRIPEAIDTDNSVNAWERELSTNWDALLIADSKHIGSTAAASTTHAITNQIRGFIWLAQFTRTRTFVIVGQRGDRISGGILEFAQALNVEVILAVEYL